MAKIFIQEQIWHSIEIIEQSLKVRIGGTSWRDNGDHYLRSDDSKYRSGTVSFALAWFQQAMEVRI